MPEPTGLARLPLMHLERMTRFGVPRAELLRLARLDEEHLRDPDARVPLSTVARLWRAVTSQVHDPTIGLHLGADVHVREFGLVGYTMVFSKTLGAALARLVRYD